MIGWFCDVGYSDSLKTNLNDITWTDVNKPYTIATVPELPDGTSVYVDTPEELFSILENIFGPDLSTIYGISPSSKPYNDDTTRAFELNKFYVPSISLPYPNLLDISLSSTSTIYTYCYVKNLNCIFVNKSSNWNSGRQGTVSGDIISYTSNSDDIVFGESKLTWGSSSSYVGRSGGAILCFHGNENEMGDISKYSIVDYYFSTTDKQYYRKFNSWRSVHTNYCSSVFGKNIPPDFTVITPPNPYEPGGPSGEGGGGGNFDDNSDPIPDSSLPTISSANTGFTRIYNPTLSQVQALARYLWTDESVIQTIWNHIKQYFENPMEAIIGFNLVPVPVPDGGTQNFALMYIDTGVSMTVAANQFVDVDCGTLEISPYYGSALDYSPYTKISCFLPFIGTVQLNVDEVMNTILQVKYRVDICSGSCVAKILVKGNVLYQYSGHCAINIPISAADFSSYVTASISVAKLAIGAAVGGGMGALMAGGDNPVQQTNQVVTTTQVTNTARNPNTGRQITTGTQTTVQTVERPNDQSSTQGSYAGLVPENITNTVGQIMSSKPHVEHSGSFSGNTGYLGVRRPYVIIQRPNMCMPSQYQAFNGFPSMITLSLGECKGFTKVQQVQLTGFYATNPEQAEILQLLKSGVIL